MNTINDKIKKYKQLAEKKPKYYALIGDLYMDEADFKNATAVSIANKILEGGEEYFAKYKKFLSAGGSLAPLDIIRLADVDLESDAPYELAMKEFSKTLDELEKSFELQ